MQTVSLAPDHFVDVLRRLPPDLDLDALALSAGAIRRKRVLTGGAKLLRLALARGPGGLSLKQTAAWAETLGFARMSDPGIKYRLDHAVGFLDAILGQTLAANTGNRPIHWPGRILRIADGSSISKPGSKGTDWRIHGVYDLGQGGFSHLELTDNRGGEALSRGAAVPGEIRIGDRNYANLQALREFCGDRGDDGGGGTDFIVRLRWTSFTLSLPGGDDFDLLAYLGALPGDIVDHEIALQASTKSGKCAAPLPLRLLVHRKSPEATEKERKRLRQMASRKGRRLDPGTLVVAEFVLVATSLPQDYAAVDILDAYRLRWQIELAFKRMKSLIHIDKLPTWTERASRSWLLSFMLMAILCDNMNQDLLDSFP